MWRSSTGTHSSSSGVMQSRSRWDGQSFKCTLLRCALTHVAEQARIQYTGIDAMHHALRLHAFGTAGQALFRRTSVAHRKLYAVHTQRRHCS